MPRQSIFDMKFSNVFPLSIQKAERKSRTRAKVYEVTAWLTGYTSEQIDVSSLALRLPMVHFSPMHLLTTSKAGLIKGKICGVQVETIDDPLMKKDSALTRQARR